jgi:hypothetical protein
VTGASDDNRLGAGEYAAPGEPELQRLKRAYLENADPDWGAVCVKALDGVLAALASAPTEADRRLYQSYIDDAMATMGGRLSARGEAQD